MKLRGVFRSVQRAVSPIVATLLLIALAVIAGVLLYAFILVVR